MPGVEVGVSGSVTFIAVAVLASFGKPGTLSITLPPRGSIP